MSNKEKEIIKSTSAEELNENSLDNVAGGYSIAGKGDVWVVNGITADNHMFTATATSKDEAFDIAKKKKLKSGVYPAENNLWGIDTMDTGGTGFVISNC